MATDSLMFVNTRIDLNIYGKAVDEDEILRFSLFFPIFSDVFSVLLGTKIAPTVRCNAVLIFSV